MKDKYTPFIRALRSLPSLKMYLDLKIDWWYDGNWYIYSTKDKVKKWKIKQ